MNILFINSSGEGAYLPHVPPDFEISATSSVDEVQTLTGVVSLPNQRGLRSFSISALFPIKKYAWINRNANLEGWDYVRYFNDAIDNMDILKVYVLSDDGRNVLYMKCLVEDFTYRVDRVGDVTYSLSVKEYAEIDPQKVVKQ